MPEFSDVVNALFELQNRFPDLDVTAHDGYLTINVYVGIENTDLFRQGQVMFSPVD